MTTLTKKAFQSKIYDHYKKRKRSLPWRHTHDPYKILVSEMMLQQTQSARVIPKYQAFIKAFPTVADLASAQLKDVLVLWQGLGYNRRALMLWRAAETIIKEYNGRFPKTHDELLELPGIGPYTASAIMVFAYDAPQVLIETNIRTVFIHCFFPRSKKVPDAKLMPLIETYADPLHPREWYNALMDYGAMLKAEIPNPSRKSAHHVTQSKFNGSVRQVRGAIIRAYAADPALTKRTLLKAVPYIRNVVVDQYEKLKKEGFFA